MLGMPLLRPVGSCLTFFSGAGLGVRAQFREPVAPMAGEEVRNWDPTPVVLLRAVLSWKSAIGVRCSVDRAAELDRAVDLAATLRCGG